MQILASNVAITNLKGTQYLVSGDFTLIDDVGGSLAKWLNLTVGYDASQNSSDQVIGIVTSGFAQQLQQLYDIWVKSNSAIIPDVTAKVQEFLNNNIKF